MIDAALCVQAASRVMAALLRLYHVDDEADVTEAMAAPMRSHIPLVEAFGDETVVTARTTRLRATRDQTSICCRATTDSEQSLPVRSPTTRVSHGNHSRRLNYRANVRFGSERTFARSASMSAKCQQQTLRKAVQSGSFPAFYRRSLMSQCASQDRNGVRLNGPANWMQTNKACHAFQISTRSRSTRSGAFGESS
jgi:hypothetical protein